QRVTEIDGLFQKIGTEASHSVRSSALNGFPLLLLLNIPAILRGAVMKNLAPACVFLSLAVSARAQTIDDGIMVTKRSLFTGDIYGYESWDHYWEGALKRENGNA